MVVICISASMHALMDTLGGGKEMRPWKEEDERAVYNHFSGKWIPPKRFFYDGSIPDLAISTISTALLLLLFNSLALQIITATIFLLSLLYTILRKKVTDWIGSDYNTFSEFIKKKLSEYR